MGITLPILVSLATLLTVLAVAALLALWALRSAQPSPEDGASEPWALGAPDHVVRHARRTRVTAALVAVLATTAFVLGSQWLAPFVAVAVGPAGPTGLALALAPLLVTFLYVLTSWIGERTWPRPAGEVRSASLAQRSLSSTSPAALRWMTLGWSAALTVVLVWCGLVGDGTLLTVTTGDGDDVVAASSSGPFPGWPYAIPMLLALAATLLLTWSTLDNVRRRPAITTIPPDQDEGLRRGASGRVLRIAQLGTGLTLAGTLFFAGSAVRAAGQGWPTLGIDGPWWGVGGSWLMVAGPVIAIVSAIVALVPWDAPARSIGSAVRARPAAQSLAGEPPR